MRYLVTLLALVFLFASPTSAQVTVSWSWLSEIEETGFELERSPEGCTDWALIGTFPANIMSTEDIDVPGNCYRVRAFDTEQFYPYSNIAIVEELPPPPPPVDNVAPIVSILAPAEGDEFKRKSRVTIRSEFSDDVGVVSVRYLVNMSALDCEPLATSCIWDMPAPPFKTYTIRVEARDAAGNVGADEVNVRSLK